jgi:hypothetical protein
VAAPATALAQHPAAEQRLHSSMAWSGILIGLMPFAIGLVVLGIVAYHRFSTSRRTTDGDPD